MTFKRLIHRCGRNPDSSWRIASNTGMNGVVMASLTSIPDQYSAAAKSSRRGSLSRQIDLQSYRHGGSRHAGGYGLDTLL
jgi:hypothetical protein